MAIAIGPNFIVYASNNLVMGIGGNLQGTLELKERRSVKVVFERRS